MAVLVRLGNLTVRARPLPSRVAGRAFMGLYPMYSGRPDLSVSVPMLPSFVIQRDNGATLSIQTQGPVNGTLQRLLVNGQPHSSALLPVSQLLSARHATLEFFLQ